jgi:hypothetical protein
MSTSRASLPLSCSVNSIDILARYAASHGIETDVLLDGSGIKPKDLDDPEILISPEQELSVMRKLAALAPSPEAGLKVGEQYHITARGVLGRAALCCETLLDAIRMVLPTLSLPVTTSISTNNIMSFTID